MICTCTYKPTAKYFGCAQRLVLGVKRTWLGLYIMSANDPKRTSAPHKTEFNPPTWQTELRFPPIRLQAATIRLSRIDTIENTRGRRGASISTRPLYHCLSGSGPSLESTVIGCVLTL